MNPCAGVSFNKDGGFRSENLLKTNSYTDVSCEYCEIFMNSFLYKTFCSTNTPHVFYVEMT